MGRRRGRKGRMRKKVGRRRRRRGRKMGRRRRIVLRKKICKKASMRSKVIRKAAILAAVQIKRTRNRHLRRSVRRNIPARLHKIV